MIQPYVLQARPLQVSSCVWSLVTHSSVFTGVGFAIEFLFAKVFSANILSCTVFTLFLCIRLLLFKVATIGSDTAISVWTLTPVEFSQHFYPAPWHLKGFQQTMAHLCNDWNSQASNVRMRILATPMRPQLLLTIRQLSWLETRQAYPLLKWPCNEVLCSV